MTLQLLVVQNVVFFFIPKVLWSGTYLSTNSWLTTMMPFCPSFAKSHFQLKQTTFSVTVMVFALVIYSFRKSIIKFKTFISITFHLNRNFSASQRNIYVDLKHLFLGQQILKYNCFNTENGLKGNFIPLKLIGTCTV